MQKSLTNYFFYFIIILGVLVEKLLKERKQGIIRLIFTSSISFIVAVLFVIALEGMIYGIYINAAKTTKSVAYSPDTTIAYVDKNKEEGKYRVYYYNETYSPQWCSQLIDESERQNLENAVSKVVNGAPSAFELSITPTHYVVIALFLGAVACFFVFKFVDFNNNFKLAKKELEKQQKNEEVKNAE